MICFCSKVAADAKDKLFIATSCCVQAMNNVWYDKIHPQQSKTRNEISMAISFFTLGFLAPFIVTYRQGAGVRKFFIYLNKLNKCIDLFELGTKR
jgi:hypothetical protein